MKLEFSQQIFEKYSMKIRPLGVELFHVDALTDRQADVTKLIVAFRNFANAPQKWKSFSIQCSPYQFWD
jgi:hypothetical protein